MTGTSSSDRVHLSPETVADLKEGLLDARETLAAQGHLLGCPRCSALAEEIRTVSDLLAGAGDVGPVPVDVAARLDEALAAERPAAAAPTATVTPLSAETSGPRGMRVLQVAAVLVVLLAGVGVGVSALRSGSDDAGTRTTNDSAGAAEAAPGNGSYPVTASGRNWSADTLVGAVPQLVAGTFPAASPQARAAEQDGGVGSGEGGTAKDLAANEASRLAGGPPLAECVTALADGPVTPLAVDIATWQGQPAAVVVLPNPDDPATVDAWVVSPDCSQADATLLYFARTARP